LTGHALGGILHLMRERATELLKPRLAWPRLMEDDPGRSETGNDRGRLVEAACRGAMLILESRKDRSAVLRRQDPVPTSTRELLRRLARA
jgi:hypothetical protein